MSQLGQWLFRPLRRPSFEVNPGNTVCQNSELLVNNTSFSGEEVTEFSCSQLYGKYWTVTPINGAPSNGYTVTHGDLGDSQGTSYYLAWNNGSDDIGLTFNEPGEYVITLTTGNTCSGEEISDTICVMPSVFAHYTPDNNQVCAGDEVSLINESSSPGCIGYSNIYDWEVTYANPENCGSSDYSFIESTDENSTNPELSFNEPGLYIISLTTTLSPSLTGESCSFDIYTDTIIVIGPPLLNTFYS